MASYDKQIYNDTHAVLNMNESNGKNHLQIGNCNFDMRSTSCD